MKNNIVLIGFMASGKTTIGKELASIMDVEFLDSDTIIEKDEKMSVKEIFEIKGEAYFREIERKTIFDLSSKSDKVISVGGGAVVDSENVKNLKKNSLLIYLDCNEDLIYKRALRRNSRPLLNVNNVKETIGSLLKIRKPLYEKAMDFKIRININTSIYDIAKKIKNIYINYD